MAGQSGSERTRLWKLRKAGKIKPLQECKSCGKTLKAGCGNGRASSQGLCYACWRRTPEFRIEHRRSNLLKERREGGEVWAVGYWSQTPGATGEPVKYGRLREAVNRASGGRGREPGPVFVAWSDARVTEHHGLKVTNCTGLTPDHPSALEYPVDNPWWFLDQVDKSRRAWFEG